MKIRRKGKKDKVNDPSGYQVIVNDIEALNRKYIQLFIDLHTHCSIVDENFYIAAQSALTEQYQAELELLKANARHATEEKFYLADSRTAALGIYTYRRHFKRRSSPMKQILDERIEREVEGYFTEMYSGLEPLPEEDPPENIVPSEEANPECDMWTADEPEEPEEAEEPEPVEYEPEEDNFEELYELEKSDTESASESSDSATVAKEPESESHKSEEGFSERSENSVTDETKEGEQK